MTYGVLVDGKFQPRELEQIRAKGFKDYIMGREGTYDQYVMKEISRSYGKLKVKDKRVLDVGANIGAFSCWAAEHGAKSVIALEPEEHNFNLLMLNCAQYEGVKVFRRALHSTENNIGSLYLSKTGKNPGNSSTTPRRGRIEVPIHYLQVGEIPQDIEVAKIDCEGAEYEFIDTLIPHLPKLEQLAIEIHINGFGLDKAEALHDYILTQGFKPVVEPRLQENLWQTIGVYKRKI